MPLKKTNQADLSVIIRKLVRGSPEQVFQAWTEPEQVVKWWGPADVSCSECQIDLSVGGAYKIGNLLPDGSVVWIIGKFLKVERPNLLSYSWQSGLQAEYEEKTQERVTVRFVQRGELTEVIVEHCHISEAQTQRNHTLGWAGCLKGIEEFCSQWGNEATY
ncbi:MAG: SRPBCC domain-containing protein [Hyphomicrobiales bacterium]